MKVIAETYMHALPEFCGECDYCDPTTFDRKKCGISGLLVDAETKPAKCRLHAVDDDAFDAMKVGAK